jgi:hypothetical protein
MTTALFKKRIDGLARTEKRRERLNRIIKKAAEFHRIGPGWYFGRGERISAEAIGYAIFFVKLAFDSGLWRSNVFPRVDGGVRIDFIHAEHTIELSIESAGAISIEHTLGEDAAPSLDELTIGEAVLSLRAIARQACTSESSTPDTSTTKRIESLQKPAIRLLATDAYLSSANSVPTVSLGHLPIISAGSTPQLHQTRRFSGGSRPPINQQTLLGTSSPRRATMIPAM